MSKTSPAQDQIQPGRIAAPSTPPLELVVTRPELYLLPNKKKQRRKIWFVVLGLSVVIGAGLLLVRRQLNSQRNASFETAKIERGPIQAFITATGNLNPVVNVQVGSQVSGNIKTLYADFNTKVRKGQLVAQIDPEIFQAQVDAASAASINTRRQRPLPTLNWQKRPLTSRRSRLPEPVCRQLPRKITQFSSTFRNNGDARKDSFKKVSSPRRTTT
jgi:hypothetical protein